MSANGWGLRLAQINEYEHEKAKTIIKAPDH